MFGGMLSAVGFGFLPSGASGFCRDPTTVLGRQHLRPRSPPLLSTEASQCYRSRVFGRLSGRTVLNYLACGKINDQLRKLVCVARTLA
jgi:hypothetical protein